MKKTILITGGAGFVGSNLAILLKENNPEWRILSWDNLMRRGSELNLPRLRKHGVEFLHGDVRNPEDLAHVGLVDVLIECSAEPSVMAGYEANPTYAVNTNLVGTLHCLEYVRKHGAALIFLSTSRVYPMGVINNLQFKEGKTRFDLSEKNAMTGMGPRGFAEEFSLEGCRSLYGATKLSCEFMIQEYLDMYDLRGVINRCSVLAGPWQMGKIDQGFAALWVGKHYFGQPLSYFGFGGLGKQVRDVLHVHDLFRLVQIQIAKLNELKGQVFNVGGGMERSVSLMEMTELCREITGKTIPIGTLPEGRKSDVQWYVTDCTRAERIFGWRPQKSVRQLVTDIHDWIRDNEEALRPFFVEEKRA